MSKLDDIKFMTMAIELAKKGNYRTHPNPLVGAIIVKDNKILSKGFHRRFRGKHAEREAIDKTKQSLKGATMYVTLEPCCHHGNTPPCVDLIIKNKISRVVIASKDPNPLVNEKSINKLKDNEWLDLNFEPIPNSRHKRYYLQISGLDCHIGSSATLYYDSKEKTLGGGLYINKNKFTGNLSMRTYCLAYNSPLEE